MTQRILVWDLPTRIFHWTLVTGFTGAFLTAESERWRNLHELFGYTVLAVLAFRLIWGFAGTRYARFAEFVRGPRAVLSYLCAIREGRPPHFIGHNPAGSVAVVLLISLGLLSSVSGWLLSAEIGGEGLEDALEDIHEVLSNTMLIVVLLHVAGVVFSSIVHRENLAWAMFTGKKRGESHQAIGSARSWAAILLLAAVAGLWAWDGLSSGRGFAAATSSSAAELDDHENGGDDADEADDED